MDLEVASCRSRAGRRRALALLRLESSQGHVDYAQFCALPQ